MEEALYISKSRILPESQDYEFLRKEGFRYIENLAHRLWTDYNEHDPGITILEALCFAITELGYRTGFDIKDLMTSPDGTLFKDQTFYSAREIFTCNPVSVEDYRKLLIDILGVHNAWMIPKANVQTLADGEVIPSTEVPLYPDCQKDALTYTKKEHDAIDIRGLYEVILDLDYSNEFGDLNWGNLTYPLVVSEVKIVNIDCILPKWNQLDWQLLSAMNFQNPKSVTITKSDDRWIIKLVFEVNGVDEEFGYSAGLALKIPLANLNAEVESALQNLALQKEIIDLYYRKTTETRDVLLEVKRRLNAHRNLCEDFIKIDTVDPVEIGFCADIEIKPEADIEQVLAEVYFQIEEYFNPDVKFYSLKEMVDKGIPSEEIFEGPKLAHGFIDTDELINTNLRSEIRVSDIINLIMDIEGVLAIKNVILTEYDEYGKAKLPGQKWCLHLSPYQKPVLSIFKSKVLFFKENLPFKANADETRDILAVLRGLNERNKLKGHDNDFPMPQGEYFQLDDYLTVQYELPQTYGISEAGLPSTATADRKAKAMQLRAYLMFYDQILANYFAQLHQAKHLFSTDEDLQQTYFATYLGDIKDIQKIYLNASDLEKVLSDPAAAEDPEITNTRFNLLESSERGFFSRRNRFLDHLLARFSESFSDYVLMLYQMDGGQYKKNSQDKLVKDKIAFLKDYPAISGNRGKAFDYLYPLSPESVWDNENVSGLEKRLARITGIANFSKRDLFCFPFPIKMVPEGSGFGFSVEESPSKSFFKSVTTYATKSLAESAINKVYDSLYREERYKLEHVSASKYFVKLKDAYDNDIAISTKSFTKTETANAFIENAIHKFSPTCDSEGMLLIEHLLLRPRFEVDVLPPDTKEEYYRVLKVCLEKDCHFCGEEDPYSFRVSVILPFWPERFRDMNFRTFFENTVNLETPAHIHAKVCWINYTSMFKLQAVYKEWLEALRAFSEDLIMDDQVKKDQFREANNKLVELLGQLTSEYPEARLHDCETGVTNPVRLGKTILGSF